MHADSFGLQGLLAGLDFVKDVHPEQRVTRSLAWAKQEECDSHSGSLCDVGPHAHINKRPGRCLPPLKPHSLPSSNMLHIEHA